MKEYIKQGMGFTLGVVLSMSLIKWFNEIGGKKNQNEETDTKFDADKEMKDLFKDDMA